MEKKALSNQSIVKAFSIIELLASSHEAMRLQDIAAQSGIPASTALRLLNTLMRLNYVSQSAQSNMYRLTLKFSQISEAVTSKFDLRGLIHPYLISLSDASRESTCLAIERDMTAVYIDVVTGPDSMIKTMQYIGKSAPMHCTGVGKLLLTDYSGEKLDEYLQVKQLLPFTPNTITSKEQLLQELADIMKKGYSIDDEECELGARCIAAPIRNYTGKIVACISVSGPTIRMNMKQVDRLKPIIVEIASKVSKSLAYANQPLPQDQMVPASLPAKRF